MRCDATQSALIDFYYQELAPPDHRATSAHLINCQECASEYRGLFNDLEEMEGQWTEAPRLSLGVELRAMVQKEIQPTIWQRLAEAIRIEVPVYQAAMAAAMGIALWFGVGATFNSTQVALPGSPPTAEATKPAPARSTSVEQTVPMHYDAQGLMAIDQHVL